jgi:hypothetical protein
MNFNGFQLTFNKLNSKPYMVDFLVHFNERFLLALKFISERVLILVQDLSITYYLLPKLNQSLLGRCKI